MWPIIKKAVNSDLSTPLNTLINNVKSTVNDINAKVNTVNTNVGSNADAASATGSAHAKLAHIVANTGIKSIQRGTIALGKSDTTKAATISAVNTAKAMVNLLGVSSHNAYGYFYYDASGLDMRSYYARTAHHFVRLQLTNATTVTATRAYHNDTDATVSYEVIEFV